MLHSDQTPSGQHVCFQCSLNFTLPVLLFPKKHWLRLLSFLIFSDFICISLYAKCVKLKASFCNFTLTIYCCSKLKYCFLSHYQCCCSKYKFSLRPFLSISLYTKCELSLFELYSLISHFQCCCSFDAF